MESTFIRSCARWHHRMWALLLPEMRRKRKKENGVCPGAHTKWYLYLDMGISNVMSLNLGPSIYRWNCGISIWCNDSTIMHTLSAVNFFVGRSGWQRQRGNVICFSFVVRCTFFRFSRSALSFVAISSRSQTTMTRKLHQVYGTM